MVYGTLVTGATDAVNLLSILNGSVTGAGHASPYLVSGLTPVVKDLVIQWASGALYLGDASVSTSDAGYKFATGLPPLVLHDDRGIPLADFYIVGNGATAYVMVRN